MVLSTEMVGKYLKLNENKNTPYNREENNLYVQVTPTQYLIISHILVSKYSYYLV